MTVELGADVVLRVPGDVPVDRAAALVRSLPGSGITIHSVFDSQGRRIAEYNEATGALIREYVWIGWEPVAVIEGGIIYHVRADHIGRPVFATNASGTKVWTASYLPFGSVHVTAGTPIEARFPGQWYQAESGLHQNWLRDYDPTTGRYLQADPLGLVAGMSIYGYALQNPGRYTDPRGENPAAAVCTIPGLCPAIGQAIIEACVVVGIGAYELYNWMASDDAPPQMSTPDDAICDDCSASAPPPPPDNCREQLKACFATNLSDFDGSVYGENRCSSCYTACRSNGVWPSSIKSVRNGALTCRYWKKR